MCLCVCIWEREREWVWVCITSPSVGKDIDQYELSFTANVSISWQNYLFRCFSYFLFFTDFFRLCYYSCLNFFPFVPSTQNPPLPQAIPKPLFSPLAMHISSLATPFPILYFTSPWLSCDYLFVLLTPLTSSPIPPHHPSIRQPSKCSPYPWFCLCSSCLLSLFFRFNS